MQRKSNVVIKHIRLVMYCFQIELTCQRCIVFDSFVMKIQISQVKGIFSITLIQEVGGNVGDEEAERGCEVVCRANCGIHVFE